MKKRTIVAAMLGLAAAGCAHTRKAAPDAPANQPVGMAPVPSIHETINRGFNDPNLSKRTLPDPANPNWNARYQPRADPAGTAAPAAAAIASRSPGPAATAPQPPAEIPALAPEVVLHEPTQPPRTAAGDPAVSPSSAPAPDAPPPASEIIEVANLPPVGDALDAPNPSEPRATDAQVPPASPAAAPAAPPPPDAPLRPAGAAADPLLGPNPELMPPGLQGLVSPEVQDPGPNNPSGSPAKPAAAPAPPAESPETASLNPATVPTLAPAPAPGGGGPAELSPAPTPAPELAPAPTPAPSPGPTSSVEPSPPQTQTIATRTSAPRVDSQIVRASTDGGGATAAAPAGERDEDVIGPNWKRAGETAARVGDEVITMRELVVSVKDQLRRHGVKVRDIPRDEMNAIAQNILANLIERSLIYQEAKRQLKDKQFTQMLEVADKAWAEEDLPQLLRKHAAENEPQLRLKLEEAGRSLAALKQSYRQDFIAMIYVQQKLRDKLHVELPEMLKYYNQHKLDQSNHRNARITWREIVVETSRHSDPAEARNKAEALLAKLQAGEDFSRLAKAESEGPTVVKAQGGLMETSPGGYGVASVNRTIETIPLNTVSGIIEGPSSLHIVKVERRRAAGPASFAETQDQIRREIFARKTERERRILLDKLRAETIVTSIFDGTESDPRTVRRN